MNLAHLHLLLNHFPIMGTVIGVGFLAGSLMGSDDHLERAGLLILAIVALVALPTFFSGAGAEIAIRKESPALVPLIDRHEGAALLSLLFVELTGGLSVARLWQRHRFPGHPRISGNLLATLFFAVVTLASMVRVGNTGGDIRHPEIRLAREVAPSDESGLLSVVHAIEPSPVRVTDLVLTNKWWWAFMMDLHFIGLVLIVGTVGILNLRVLGFAKALPIGPLHRLMPWAMAGFAVNMATGILAFMGMPAYYTLDAAFWLKILALVLVGLNVAAFYLTGAFRRVENLGPGEDAPPIAKFIAATSLVLWFTVIALGRYIQPFADTLTVE